MPSEDTANNAVVVSFGRAVTDDDLESLKATEDIIDALVFPPDVHIHINWDGGGFHFPPRPIGDPAF